MTILAYCLLALTFGVSTAWAKGGPSSTPEERRNVYAMRIAGLFGMVLSAFAIGLLVVLS